MIKVALLSWLWFAQPSLESPPPPSVPSVGVADQALPSGKEPILEVVLEGQSGPVVELKLAEPLTLALTAKATRQDVLFAPLVPALGSFRVVESLPVVEKAEGDSLERTWRWRIIPTRMGAEKLPSIELPYRLADGTQGSVSSSPLRTYIRGHLENENMPALGEAPEPSPIITTNWFLIWGIGLLGTALVAAALTALVLVALRHRFEALRPKAPPRPANEVALERLASLESASFDDIPAATRFAEATNTWRAYLAGRYELDALEMTNDELALALPQLDLNGFDTKELLALLNEAALVKFAGLSVSESHSQEVIGMLRRFVLDTWQAPEEKEIQILKAEPASLQQRTYAGALDVGLGLLVGGFATLVLSFQDAGALSGLGFIFTSIYLGLRDSLNLSVGKRLLRLSVVEQTEAQLPLPAAALLKRNLLLWLWPFALPLEYLVMRAHPLHHRIGDHMAASEVVRALGAARHLGVEEEAHA